MNAIVQRPIIITFSPTRTANASTLFFHWIMLFVSTDWMKTIFAAEIVHNEHTHQVNDRMKEKCLQNHSSASLNLNNLISHNKSLEIVYVAQMLEMMQPIHSAQARCATQYHRNCFSLQMTKRRKNTDRERDGERESPGGWKWYALNHFVLIPNKLTCSC